MVNSWLANIKERQQIFITSSYEQAKLSQSIKISAIFVNIHLLPEVLFRTRPRCKTAAGVLFCSLYAHDAAKIMKQLISGRSQIFFIFRGWGLLNEAPYTEIYGIPTSV
jgi:hypothetical protein